MVGSKGGGSLVEEEEWISILRHHICVDIWGGARDARSLGD